jgi:hypothetical protein
VTCTYTTPSQVPLSVERFQHLHPDGKHLIAAWLGRALAEGRGHENYFEAFIFLWFSFNGFATCITRLEHDAAIINKVANCPNLRGRFSQAMRDSQHFAQTVSEFAACWPIFKVQDLRRKNLLHNQYIDRKHMVKSFLNVPGTSHEPSCFEFHSVRDEAVPADWPHVIHTIYRVRCNLFHGEKSPVIITDHHIVRLAFLVLAGFLQHSHVLDDA